MKKFNEIRREVPADAVERARHRELAKAAYALSELRRSLDRTQTSVAQEMGVGQKWVSDIEHGDLDRAQLGTIRRYVKALGGEVNIVARFPDDGRTITIG